MLCRDLRAATAKPGSFAWQWKWDCCAYRNTQLECQYQVFEVCRYKRTPCKDSFTVGVLSTPDVNVRRGYSGCFLDLDCTCVRRSSWKCFAVFLSAARGSMIEDVFCISECQLDSRYEQVGAPVG